MAEGQRPKGGDLLANELNSRNEAIRDKDSLAQEFNEMVAQLPRTRMGPLSVGASAGRLVTPEAGAYLVVCLEKPCSSPKPSPSPPLFHGPQFHVVERTQGTCSAVATRSLANAGRLLDDSFRLADGRRLAHNRPMAVFLLAASSLARRLRSRRSPTLLRRDLLDRSTDDGSAVRPLLALRTGAWIFGAWRNHQCLAGRWRRARAVRGHARDWRARQISRARRHSSTEPQWRA